MKARLRFKRVLLKLSGEALLGDQPFGIDDAGDRPHRRRDRRGGRARRQGRRRHRRRQHLPRHDDRRRPAATASPATRWACSRTVMNAIALQRGARAAAASRRGVFSAVPMPTICETFTQQRAEKALRRGRGGALRRRHRQPVLHHRYGRGASRRRDGLRRALQGHAGRRRLLGRSRSATRRPRATTG